MALHLDVFLYCALLVLFLWRGLFFWRFWGVNLESVNYISLLYLLMHVFLVCEGIVFCSALISDVHGPTNTNLDSHTFRWVKIMMWITPLVLVFILQLTWWQSREHIHKIWRRESELQHDRALQIIALPAVYALMAMSSLSQLYKLAATEVPGVDAGELHRQREISYSRYETVFMVADLYEAWALYQFGLLTLEVLQATLAVRWSSGLGRTRDREDEVRLSYLAVSQLMWVGTAMFVVVCVIQAGWSLWQWNFGSASEDWEGYSRDLRQFRLAGLLASGAAIYNVHVVESAYAEIMGVYSPFVKFISVKMLVFFSFWQRGALMIAQDIGILQLSDLQTKLLDSTLLVFECLLSALLHRWAWNAEEPWYTTLAAPVAGKAGAKDADDETQPLLPSPQAPAV